MPRLHNVLKDVARDCAKRIEDNKRAEEVFDSQSVREHLKAMTDLVIDTLERISHFYAKSFIS